MRLVKLVVSVCAAMLLVPSLAMAQPTPLPPVNVGENPWGVAIDSSASIRALDNVAFVTNTGSGTVSVISAVNGTPVHTPAISVGVDPQGVAVDPATGWIYVANFGSDNVTAINGSNWQTTTISLPAGANLNPNSVAVDPGTNTVYVGTYMSSTVDVIQGGTGTALPTFSYSVPIPGANIHDVVAVPDNGGVWVSAYNQNELYKITGTSVKPMWSVCGADGLALDPVGDTVWVADNTSNPGCGDSNYDGVWGFSTANGGGPLWYAQSAAPAYLASLSARAVFASVPSTNTVEESDGPSIVGTVNVGPDPAMLDVDLNNGNVIVANHGASTVTIIPGW
jgi:DNA-binding beta-propeller fold protein YncE